MSASDLKMTLPSSPSLAANPAKTSNSKSVDFTANPPFTVPQNVGILTVQLEGVGAKTSSALHCLQWMVRRNPFDALTGPVPALTVDSGDRTKVSIATDGLNTQGSFNIIAYAACSPQPNYNSTVRRGIILVINLVIVQLQVTASLVSPTSAYYNTFASGLDQVIQSTPRSPNPYHPTIQFEAVLRVIGGGADGQLGLDKIHPGWIGNGAGDSFTVTYPGGNFGREVLTIPPATFPLLDTLRTPPGVGGISAYRGSNDAEFVHLSVGSSCVVTASDGPSVVFVNVAPAPSGQATSTDGTNDFHDFLACYSDDFPMSYTISGQVATISPGISWSALFKYNYAVATGWTINGAGTTGGTSLDTTKYPMTAAAAGTIVYPPVFGDSAKMNWP